MWPTPDGVRLDTEEDVALEMALGCGPASLLMAARIETADGDVRVDGREELEGVARRTHDQGSDASLASTQATDGSSGCCFLL
jgi:hypothetical protein